MKKSKGFTLVELVVVIAILGIVAGIGIISFKGAAESARGAKLLSDMRTIESMALLYATNNGRYPKVITNGNSISFEDNSKDFANYFTDGYPKPPMGIVAFKGNNGTIYRYDLSDRQYFYGFNSQVRNGASFQHTTCDSKSIFEFLSGSKGNGQGKGPMK